MSTTKAILVPKQRIWIILARGVSFQSILQSQSSLISNLAYNTTGATKPRTSNKRATAHNIIRLVHLPPPDGEVIIKNVSFVGFNDNPNTLSSKLTVAHFESGLFNSVSELLDIWSSQT